MKSSFDEIKWQNANDFYHIMYDYKTKVCSGFMMSSETNVAAVVLLFKNMWQLYAITSPYFKKAYKDRAENLIDSLKSIKKHLYLAERINRKKNPQAKKDSRIVLKEVLDELEKIQLELFELMKLSKLELPVSYNDPSSAIKEGYQ